MRDTKAITELFNNKKISFSGTNFDKKLSKLFAYCGSLKLTHILKCLIVPATLLVTVACQKGQNRISTQPLSTEISESSQHILGGEKVNEKDPYAQGIVSVLDLVQGGLCTGSIISENLVITAAHCISEKMVVRFGIDVNSPKYEIKVAKAVMSSAYPKRYNAEKNTGDIAMLRLETNIPKEYKPVTLLTDSQLLIKGKPTLLAGYGITDGTAKTGSGSLRKVVIKIEDPKFSETEVVLNQTQKSGACHGDSGGPAFIRSQGKLYMWGITSRGHKDANDTCEHYSIYTNVAAHKSFIKKASEYLASL